jgi:hypothetical protein
MLQHIKSDLGFMEAQWRRWFLMKKKSNNKKKSKGKIKGFGLYLTHLKGFAFTDIH